jgi:hypothetical protein
MSEPATGVSSEEIFEKAGISGEDKRLCMVISSECPLENEPGMPQKKVDRESFEAEKGANNGYYSFSTGYKGDIIVTKDWEIAEKISKAYDFKQGGNVPFSNGAVPLYESDKEKLKNMENACAWKDENKRIERRTAAVQRGDLITLYDPNSSDGHNYTDVKHYMKEKNSDHFRLASYAEVNEYLAQREKINDWGRIDYEVRNNKDNMEKTGTQVSKDIINDLKRQKSLDRY